MEGKMMQVEIGPDETFDEKKICFWPIVKKMKEKSKNKKRRHSDDGEDDSPVPIKQIKDALGDAVGLSSKKKKRKMDTEDHGNGDSASDARQEKEGKKKVKEAISKKKKGDKKLNMKDIEKSDSPDSVHLVNKNKKKKKKELCGDKNFVDGSEVNRAEKRKKKGKVTSSDLNCGDTDMSASVGKTKKKGHDASVAETDKMGTSGAVKNKEKKKKKKKLKDKQSGLSENVVSVSKKRKKEKGVAGTSGSVVPEKKKKSKKEIDIGDTDKCNDVVSTRKKKNKDKHSVSDEVVNSEKVKKTKKRKQKDVDDIVGDGIGNDDDCVSKKKKKGKKEKSCDTVVNSVSGCKKKKRKRRNLNEGKDVENGDNTCGSPVSKSKKKSIEKVVDTENMALENPNGGNSSPASILGQWGTATFENKERQDKFYRLLGGFKKRDDALVQNTAGTNSVKKLKPYVNPNSPFLKKNLALSSSDAKNLDDNLEKDFNRAMEWKLTMPRGTGIGYTPPPDANKLFYIDKTKSTSVKFD